MPRDLVDEVDPLNKRKVSPMKPTSQKKSKATLTKMQTVLTVDDFDFIIATVADASHDILHKKEAKHEEMYDRIEFELRGVQQALQSNHTVSTVPPPSEERELEPFFGTGADLGFNAYNSAPTKTLTTCPFGNTCKADEVSPEVEVGVVARLRCLQP
jgi:hypothetical protein